MKYNRYLYTFNETLNVSIGDLVGSMYVLEIAYDRYSSDLTYISLVGYKSIIDEVARLFNNPMEQFNIRSRRANAYKRRGARYVVDVNKNGNSDIVNAVIFLKDSHKVLNNGEEWTMYFYMDANEDQDKRVKELLLDKLVKYSSVPVLPDWIDYIYERVQDDIVQSYHYIMQGTREVNVCRLHGDQTYIKNIIADGLSNGDLNINGSNESSVLLEEISGLDNYLSLFGSLLANKIQEKFKPKFVPGTDPYSPYLLTLDDYIHHKGVELYAAQMAVIQANANNFNINKHGFIVGEMGSGKTIMTGSTFYVHNASKNKGFNALIMSPSHLVEKWKQEMEKYVPNSKGYIVHNLDELLVLEDKLRNPNRFENMFVIMSKEIAKLGFDERPAAIWSTSKGCYVCPECGQPLYKEESVQQSSYSRRKVKVKVKLTELDFLKQYAYNVECPNKVKYWDEQDHVYKERTCNAKLWTALNRDDDHGWLKLGEQGWIQERHIVKVTEDFMSKQVINKKETALFDKLFEQYDLYQNGMPFKHTYKGSKKYPVAKYIKERMNGVFDYLALDEAHLLMNNSLQGIAAHHLMKACGHTLLLTGTLLNGFAANLFYTLFRVCPNIMRQEGFTYDDEPEFARLFGVVSRESVFRLERGIGRSRVGNVKEKRLPGVSPLVFTKFLLNLTSFITLNDMAEGLPAYQEIPVGVPMDRETAIGYNQIQQFFTDRIRAFESGARKIMGSVVKLMTQYPDAPHCLRRVQNPDTGDLEFESTVLDKAIRNKEQKLLEIVQDKLANEEKVLVFYNTVNTTDIGEHLQALFASEDINSFELRASVKAEKRMEYIEKELKKGAQVMITNPSLVETGLDLLEFTTIVFYQVGYNLSTMRQASRRSWRLSQTKDIEVYFLYYTDTIQEQAISLMATKLQAAQTLEGNFSEEGLKAMSQNDDMLTQIANNVVNDIKTVVDLDAFKSARHVKNESNKVRPHSKTIQQIEYEIDDRGQKIFLPKVNKHASTDNKKTYIKIEYIRNPIKLFIQ